MNMEAEDGMKTQNVFGDNMSLMLPHGANDVSNLRELPDNQEVYTHPVTDQSIILEILQYVQEPDEQALRTHFEELADSNDARGPDNSKIVHIEEITQDQDQLAMTQCQHAYFLEGEQFVSKFNESAKNKVKIYMGLFRLPQHETDILLTMNDPVSISPQSSSHQQPPADGAQPWSIDHFRLSVTTLRILNIGLLG